MRVTIGGTEYVAVTAKRITVDGVVYAELMPDSPTRIIDHDNDVWVPDPGKPGHYQCISSDPLPSRTREEIEKHYGITSEET